MATKAKDGWNHCIDTIIKEGIDKDVEDNTSLCKWQWGVDYAQVECMGDRILFESRRLFTYCPYCGKKIEEIR